MENHHLDFMSPANETPREKNFDDVFAELNREDALIVEEHIGNIPRMILNYANCVAFIKNHLIEAVVEGNYEIVEKTEQICTVLINGSQHDLWIGNGINHFKFYDGWYEKSFTSGIKFYEKQKTQGYEMAMQKISQMPETEKELLQKEINELTSKMNAL